MTRGEIQCFVEYELASSRAMLQLVESVPSMHIALGFDLARSMQEVV